MRNRPRKNSTPVVLDKNGFDELFKKYYPRLTAYATLFVDARIAEDIVQDFFLHLWRNSHTTLIHTSLEAYIFKSVYHRCLNYIKHQKLINHHHSEVELEFQKPEFKYYNPDNNELIKKLYLNDLQKKINDSIEKLPERCREVFILSYSKEYKNREIAEILGISISTVENHITNALKLLRKYLSNLPLLLIFFKGLF